MSILRDFGHVMVLLSTTAIATGQSISVANNPVAPGSTAFIVLDNTGPNASSYAQLPNSLHAFRNTGELAFPLMQPQGSQSWVPVGSVSTLTLSVPPTGPGSSGSYVLHYASGDEAVTRIDVGAPAQGMALIHCWPGEGHDIYRGHGSPSSNFGFNAWKFANLDSEPHTFSSSDFIFVFHPNVSSPIYELELEGKVVPARGVLRISMGPGLLPAGPLQVVAVWADPGTGEMESRSHGLRRSESRVDMHFPAGRSLPVGGSLPIFLAMSQFSPAPVGGLASVPYYGVMLSTTSGMTCLAPSFCLPLPVGDPLAIASLANNAGGFLQNNVGQGIPDVSSGIPVYNGTSTAPYCTISHPNVPGLSMWPIVVAALAFDPVTGMIGTSQQETIVLE